MYLDFSIDWETGEYVCDYCGKKFPTMYYRKNEYGRTITRKMAGAAKANLLRHLVACKVNHKHNKE